MEISEHKILLPSRKKLGDLSPAVAKSFVGVVDDFVLFLSPWRLLHLWVKVVVPPLTALLSNPPLEVLGDHWPTLRAVLVYQVNNLHKYHQRRYLVGSFCDVASFIFWMDGVKPLVGFIKTTSWCKEGNHIFLLVPIYSQQQRRQISESFNRESGSMFECFHHSWRMLWCHRCQNRLLLISLCFEYDAKIVEDWRIVNHFRNALSSLSWGRYLSFTLYKEGPARLETRDSESLCFIRDVVVEHLLSKKRCKGKACFCGKYSCACAQPC